MNRNRQSISQIALKVTASVALYALGAGSGIAQTAPKSNTGADGYGDARQLRSWCLANTMGAKRADCLEYSYANPTEKSKSAQESDSTDFAGNALSRCNVFKGEDRVACDARVKGLGSNTGSVQSGGVLKEVTTVTRPDVPGVVTVEPKKP